MPGNTSKSVVINDCTNISFGKADLGHNSSFSTDVSIENETLLSKNSNVSINGLLGAKSFIERVQCASDVSQLSILFPIGCLDNKKVKKKKKQSSLNSSTTSEPSLSLSLEDQDSNSTSSNERRLQEQPCSVNFTFDASSESCSLASFNKSPSSEIRNDVLASSSSRKVEVSFPSINSTCKGVCSPQKDESIDTEGVLEGNTNTYSPDKENKDGNAKKLARKCPGKSYKNKKHVSIHFEFDSTLKNDVIQVRGSCMDHLENGLSRELSNKFPDSNSDKVSGMIKDSHSELSVNENILNKISQVCNKSNTPSSKDSKDISHVGTVNIPLPNRNCESDGDLKETENTQINTEGINVGQDSQHEINSICSIENSNKTICPSKTRNSWNCNKELDYVAAKSNNLGKHSEGEANDKCEDENNSGSESMSKGDINCISRINTNCTLTSNSQDIFNPTDTSLERLSQCNSDKGKKFNSLENVHAFDELVNAKSCTDEDIPTSYAIHSFCSPTSADSLVIEKTNEMELLPHINPFMNPEEKNVSKNKYENHNGTLQQSGDIDCDKEANNASIGIESDIPTQHLSQNVIHDVSVQDEKIYLDKFSTIKIAEVPSKAHEKVLTKCDDQLSNSELQPKSAEGPHIELLDNEEQSTIHGTPHPESNELNLPYNENELSPNSTKDVKDMHLEHLSTENEPLDVSNHSKSGNFLCTNLTPPNQNCSEKQHMTHISSVKISDIPDLSQTEDKLSTPKHISHLNSTNHLESSHASTEFDVSIRATSPILNCVAQPLSLSVSFTGKYTDDSERLRDSNTEGLAVESLRSKDMTFSRSKDSSFNEEIPGIIETSFVEILPSVEKQNDKSHKQKVSQEVFSSPKAFNKSDENTAIKTKNSHEVNKVEEKISDNETKKVGSTDISSGQTISAHHTETNTAFSSESRLIQGSPEKIQCANLPPSSRHYKENNQEIDIQSSLKKPNAPAMKSSSRSENNIRDDDISKRVLSPKSKSPKKCYSLRKSVTFLPKCNEKGNITKGRRTSVTFASTARLRSDSQSGEISLNISPGLKSPIISTSDNMSTATPCNVDSEIDMSMTEAISVIPKDVQGAYEGRKNCHSTPIKNIQTKSHDEHLNNNKENFSKDNHIFACPEVPQQKLTRSKTGNISNNDRKRSQNGAEESVVGCNAETSRDSFKRRKTIDKTINELSYDTFLDVNEIPLDNTLRHKKIIYHSTPINPVLEKKCKVNLSSRGRGSSLNHKDKIIQVSKTFFGTSSEANSNISKKKSSDEMSTSFSYGGKLAGSRRRTLSLSSNSNPKRSREEEVSPKRFSRRTFSSQSSTLGNSCKYISEQSTAGNKASNEESSSIRVLRSGIIKSMLSQSTYETTSSPRVTRVRFRNFSSHIDSSTLNSTNNSLSRGSTSVSNPKRNIDEFDLTPGTPSRVSSSAISQSSLDHGTTLDKTALEIMVSRSDDLKRNVKSSVPSINHETLESLASSSEYSLSTTQILSLQSKVGVDLVTSKQDSNGQLPSLHRRRNNHDSKETVSLMIDGKLYVPPKIKFCQKWVSPELLDFCVNKLKNSYDLEATIVAERIVAHLCATVSAIKPLNNYNDIKAQTLVLRNILKKYNICSNMLEYYSLMMKFTPYEFQRKVLPMGGYFGSLKVDSIEKVKIGDPIITESEIMNIS